MRRTSRARRALWGALALLCVLGTSHGSANGRTGGDALGAWSALAAARVDAPFRLGTAGRPFAWSTAIGDLNADGSLDYAVADRVGRDAGGFEYSLQLSISGLASQFVTFNSPDAALSISLRDVDHDQDLDMVVSTIVSPMVIRVWLNDGRGVFSETTSRAGTAEWRAGPSLVTDQDPEAVAWAGSTSRRAGDALPADRLVSTCPAAQPSKPVCRRASLIAALGDRRRSRAPPSSAPLFL